MYERGEGVMETCEMCGNEFDMIEEGGIKSNITGKAACILCIREKPKEVGRAMVQ